MAWSVDGTANARVSYGDVSFVDGIGNFSMSIWWYANSVTADHDIFGKFASGLDGVLLWQDDVAALSSRTDTFSGWVGPGIGNTLRIEGATNAAAASTWKHVGLSFDWNGGGANTRTLRLYVDGNEDANSPSTSTTDPSTIPWHAASEPLYIGRSGRTNYANGVLAEGAIWDSVLSAGEFAALGAGVSAKMVRPWSLVFWAPLLRTLDDMVGGLAGSTISGGAYSDHPRIIYPRRRFDFGVSGILTRTRNLAQVPGGPYAVYTR